MPEDNLQLFFVCWVYGGISIQTKDFWGTMAQFEQMLDKNYSEKKAVKYKEIANKCMKELMNKLNNI